ncbi:methylated-DNA--[protein]-cysteine S-methyltransferase [Peredibacter sp. HCB2-198]|uniref:methylated-DNA--[protein]-cysteine S-methyltransferase n=1 Tax=Peredibacter sp. HCB2-198 TaxID=3383025 RepID=UPI0038B6357A
MKEQSMSVILPLLPIVGALKLTTHDGRTLSSIHVVEPQEPEARNAFFEDCYQKLLSYLSGESQELDIPTDLREVSPFQLEVLNAMRAIPFGKVASYRDLAVKMNSRAFQAIGTACGRNPLMLIYPCHRVVGSKDLGGFAHGLEMKKALLGLESAR